MQALGERETFQRCHFLPRSNAVPCSMNKPTLADLTVLYHLGTGDNVLVTDVKPGGGKAGIGCLMEC